MMQGISGMAQGIASGAQMMQSQSNFNKMLDSGALNAGANAPVISGLNAAGLVRTASALPTAANQFSGYNASPQMAPAGLTYSNIPTASVNIKKPY